MTKEEFAKKIKELKFTKTPSANGARGYHTKIPLDNGKSYTMTCSASPDMKSKRALDCAWDMMLRKLADYFGYNGDLTAFR